MLLLFVIILFLFGNVIYLLLFVDYLYYSIFSGYINLIPANDLVSVRTSEFHVYWNDNCYDYCL